MIAQFVHSIALPPLGTPTQNASPGARLAGASLPVVGLGASETTPQGDEAEDEPNLGGGGIDALLFPFSNEELDDEVGEPLPSFAVAVSTPRDGDESGNDEPSVTIDARLLLNTLTESGGDDTSATEIGSSVGIVLAPETSSDADDAGMPLDATLGLGAELPPLDGSTDGESPLAMNDALETLEHEEPLLPWSERRASVELVLADASAFRAGVEIRGEVWLGGREVAVLRAEPGAATVRVLVDRNELPNPLVTLAAWGDAVAGCPAGPQLIRLAEGSLPELLPWPAPHQVRRRAALPQLGTDGDDRRWLLTESGELWESADRGQAWAEQQPATLVALAGAAPRFVLGVAPSAEEPDTIRLWSRTAPGGPWNQLAWQIIVPSRERAEIRLVAEGEVVAVFAPRIGLHVSVNGGLHFRHVPGCSGLLAMTFCGGAGERRLLAMQGRARDAQLDVIAIDPTRALAVRIAEVALGDEEPGVDTMFSADQGSTVYALGTFGLLRVSVENPTNE